MSEGLLEVALTLRVCVSFGAPVPMPESGTVCVGPSSSIVMLEIGSNVGASLTEFTASRNAVLAAAPLVSVTVKVMVALPNRLAAGAIVKVRFVEVPDSTRFWFGTRLVLEELAVTRRLLAGMVELCTVKEMGPAVVSSSMVWVGMLEILGAPLTVMVKDRVTILLLGWASLAVTVMVAMPLELAVGVKVRVPVEAGLV